MLNKILASRQQELTREQEAVSLDELKKRCTDLASSTRSLSEALSPPALGLIAEIKGASPSRGHIRSLSDPTEIAKIYENAGAVAISVLTEPTYFDGNLGYLRLVSENVKVPVLRKDFIFSDYQIYQSRAFGADAILLMAAVVTDDRRLHELINIAHQLGLEVLLESSNQEEIERSLETEADVLGINNRDFYTLNIDLNISLTLLKYLNTNRPVISESGIFAREDVLRLEDACFNGILVGTALMESENIGLKIDELMGRSGAGPRIKNGD